MPGYTCLPRHPWSVPALYRRRDEPVPLHLRSALMLQGVQVGRWWACKLGQWAEEEAGRR